MFVPDRGVTEPALACRATHAHPERDRRILRPVDGGSLAYNPADALNFGGIFTLTTKDGLAYAIDAGTGLT